MSDRFQPISDSQFTGWVFDELEQERSLFGIPLDLIYRPQERSRLAQQLFGHPLETPFGVAAGPHTQMAQNIIVAWLCGARFIELKTVQTLDELEISKPCIDMQDLGFNVEWSQELKVEQSFEEYMRAWVLIHALHRKFGFPGATPGVVFNISVGYNMEGLLKPNMQWYFQHVTNAPETRDRYVALIARYFPEVRDIPIPARLSDNVTLSTMHGCPPQEIEQIASYLIQEHGLHTAVKLNPTLLSPERLRGILNKQLGFDEVIVPDSAFEHDLKYADAVPMLRRLQATAASRNVQFGVKLTNTLEVVNHRNVFPAKEKMMYMSGRALHALTVTLAARLAEDFQGKLPMSFSAGADAFNVHELVACGFRTITVCSDILKSGGYLRLRQYLANLDEEMTRVGAASLDDYICRRASAHESVADRDTAAWHNLRRYADGVAGDRRLHKDAVDTHRTKTSRRLDLFDCIVAPCTDECPVNQKVPTYMTLVREGRFEEAIEITRLDNPLAAILGRACNHLCEDVCIRAHYDQPLAIRDIKRFIMDLEKSPHYRPKGPAKTVRVAVIGGGPCGLSVAYFLGQAGYAVTVFETRPYVGGMVSGTIPTYRAASKVIEQDLTVLRELGVEFRFNQHAGRDFTIADLRKNGFKYIVISVGAQHGKKLGVEGEEAEGVLDALTFLRSVKEGNPPPLGRRIGIIGGGDVAMDCARSAWRLSKARVTIIYRRTIREMPAAREEIEQALEEGIEIMELVRPVRVVVRDGRVAGLVGLRMQLGDPDESGRRRPVDIPNSEFEIPLDQLIVAVSQGAELDFLESENFERNRAGYLKVDPISFETSVPNVFAGGDVIERGPESIVRALGDGRRISAAIRAREEQIPALPPPAARVELTPAQIVDLKRRRAWRVYRQPTPKRDPAQRRDFEEVEMTFDEETARKEASRCLDCHLICSLCESVCPNRAFLTYRMPKLELTVPVLRRLHGDIGFAGNTVFRVRQSLQVAVLTDFCNECGNCATFCPTSGCPYKDKPRLYLQWREFAAESDNAFMLLRAGDTWGMRGRFGGDTHTLLLDHDAIYTSRKLKARMDPRTLDLREVVPTAAFEETEQVSLEPGAIMFALLMGLKNSARYLPTASV